MYRNTLILLSAAVIMTLPMNNSALAQKTPDTNATNLNSSRSNVDRMGGGGGTGKSTTTTGTDRMGGGGGTGKGTTTTGTDRMGGGGGGKSGN